MEGANQTVVIGSQFCSPQPLQLSIKKKVYFCAGHGYQVKDGYGNFVFTIENLLGFFSSKVLVFDAADIPILTLKSKMNKNYTAGSIFLGRDKFMVKVNPNVDYAFIVSLIVILEEIVSSSRSSSYS
ncbi:PREDICTED: protein LURP-one-related 13-like [Nicotiana attenuata]|uniref:protein LURP-one-related 13-like n=1 Tax=Nicotiana attenuata TaxID=49451 RepID=UPI0009047FA4|nr:PREDICTED: protein LURP-one-related 13-like [Nicotiana attenuata]